MWGRAGAKRDTALHNIGRDLDIAPRMAKAIMYEESQLQLLQIATAMAREECAWERLEAQFLDYAAYCKAKKQQAITRRLQGKLDLTGSQKWFNSGASPSDSAAQFPRFVVG
jgi:hypothetical protein